MQREADLFAENENRETPCDCAEKQHHKELALCLESQMVFSLAPEAEGIEAEYAALDRKEVQTHSRALSVGTLNHITICWMSLLLIILLAVTVTLGLKVNKTCQHTDVLLFCKPCRFGISLLIKVNLS